MKRKLLSIVALGAFVLVLGSCGNCVKCDALPGFPGTSEKICEKDYDNTADYDAAVATREAAGWSCK